MLVVFIYGSMVWGLFPYDWTISHESHISGAITGFSLSIFLKNKKPALKKQKHNGKLKKSRELMTTH